jgi:hypothetical protein
MTKEEALKILGQALEAANKAGVFSLSDSATIVAALNKANELIEIVPVEETVNN